MRRRPMIVFLLPAVIAVSSFDEVFAGEGGLTLFTAEVNRETERVRVRAFEDGHPIEVPAAIDNAKWRPFDLRGGPLHCPALEPPVREKGREDQARRLVWGRSDQIVAFDGGGTANASGFALFSESGVEVLLQDGESRFRPLSHSSCVDWRGSRVAIAVRGLRREEIVLLSRVDTSIEITVLSLPPEVDRLVPESLTFGGNGLFFVAEHSDSSRSIYRIDLQSRPRQAEQLAGPFEETSDTAVYGARSVAFLAGEDDDELDVFVATESGAAINLTRSPGDYSMHTLRKEHLAISHDGTVVAYNLELDDEQEVFLHPVATPGRDGRIHVTHDGKFNPYIDQQVFILFDASARLYFDAGHDRNSTDLFRIGGASPLDAVNLSHTGTGIAPPFLNGGVLTLHDLAVVANDLVVYSAVRLDDDSPSVLGASSTTGETLFTGDGLSNADDFFTVGPDLYFTASFGPTQQRLMRARASPLETALSSTTTTPTIRVLDRSSRDALVHEPQAGLALLRPGEEPLTVARGTTTPQAAWVPGSQRNQVVFGRPSATPGGLTDFFVRDLENGTESAIGGSFPGILIAVSGSPHEESQFVRGDANHDAMLDVSDPMATLILLFGRARTPACEDELDSNDDGNLDVTDAVYSLNYLFFSGPAPRPPFPDAGLDPTPDELQCHPWTPR